MRRNRVRLTESQLHRVIKESVVRVLNEMDKREIVIGDPNDDIGEGYSVEIGTQSYAGSFFFKVFGVFSEQEALDAAVDYCESNGINSIFASEDEMEEYPDEYIMAGNHCLPLPADQVYIRSIH